MFWASDLLAGRADVRRSSWPDQLGTQPFGSKFSEICWDVSTDCDDGSTG